MSPKRQISNDHKPQHKHRYLQKTNLPPITSPKHIRHIKATDIFNSPKEVYSVKEGHINTSHETHTRLQDVGAKSTKNMFYGSRNFSSLRNQNDNHSGHKSTQKLRESTEEKVYHQDLYLGRKRQSLYNRSNREDLRTDDDPDTFYRKHTYLGMKRQNKRKSVFETADLKDESLSQSLEKLENLRIVDGNAQDYRINVMGR